MADKFGKVHKTRFQELGYRQFSPGCWRFVDMSSGFAVGAQYRTKAELLGDLVRYAESFGCK